MPRLDIGDVELFFTDFPARSTPEGPPVLLVHGWTCDGQDWAFQIDAFGEHHRVVTVDLRGHGRSGRPEVPDYTVQRHAADLVELLTHLQTGPVVVVGHSLGGAVAAALAVDHPDLVQAMVAVEPAYGQPPETMEWLRGAAQSFGDDAGTALAAHLLAATEPLAPVWLRTWHRQRTLGTPADLLRRSYDDMYTCSTQVCGQPESEVFLASRRCPALSFHRLLPVAAWESGLMAHAYSRVVSWEGAGHWLHQERPVEFNALVLDWIAQLPPAHLTGAASVAESAGVRA